MPRHETSRLKLSHGWLRGEDWWGDPVSGNFVKLDMLINPFIISMTEIAPPLNGVTVGDMYVVGSGATLDWAGHDGDLAVRSPDGWLFATPTPGARARLANPAGWIWYSEEGAWLGEDQDSATGPAPIGTRYDVSVFVGYEAEPTEVILAVAIPEPMRLPNSAPGSVGRSMISPMGILRLAIKRNGADVGTISFVPNSVKAEFAVVGDKVFATGDLLSVHLPANPPSGFENYGATLRMLLQNNGG